MAGARGEPTPLGFVLLVCLSLSSLMHGAHPAPIRPETCPGTGRVDRSVLPAGGQCRERHPATLHIWVEFLSGTLVPGLGSLVRHSECSVEWLDTKGTCYRLRHTHTLPS